MVDVVLLDPLVENCDREPELSESLHLAELEAYLREQSIKTHRIEARQKQIPVSEAAIEAVNQAPACICIWLQYRSLRYCQSFLTEINQKFHQAQKPIVIVEGSAATFSAEDLLSRSLPNEIDAVLLGEAEETLSDIVRRIQRGREWRDVPGLAYRDSARRINRSFRRRLTEDIDTFPTPFRRKPYFTPDEWVEIRGSRGCYGNCSFCNISTFFGMAGGSKWRGHSVKRILHEIKLLYSQGARRFYFVDDQFIGPGNRGKHRVREMAVAILKSQLNIEWQIYCRIDNVDLDTFGLMYQAGLRFANIGIEGATQSQLDRMNKQQTVEQIEQSIETLQNANITIIPSFIMFDPYSTLEEIEANLCFIRRTGFITFLGPSCTIPFAGTPLTSQLLADNLLDDRHPLIAEYLPGVRMYYPQVDTLRSAWDAWRPWIDEHFAGLGTSLARRAFVYQNSTYLQRQSDTELHIFKMAQRIKTYESEYVMSCIKQLRYGASLNRLLGHRAQWTDAIGHINGALLQVSYA